MASSNEKLKELVEELLPIYAEHLETLWRYMQVTDLVTNDLAKINSVFDSKETDELKELNEIAALTTISLADILVIAKSLVSAKSDWEKIYFIKQGYLTIYEMIKSYRTTKQKKLEELIAHQYFEMLPDFAAVRENINTFADKYKYESDMRLVRNRVAGHIHPLSEYYQLVLTLNGEVLGKALTEFIPIIQSLQLLIYKVILHGNKQLKSKWGGLEQLKRQVEDLFTALRLSPDNAQ